MQKLLPTCLIATVFLTACSNGNEPPAAAISARLRTSPTLLPVTACEDLLATVIANRKEEAKVALLSLNGGFGVAVGGPVFGGPEVAVDGADNSAPESDGGGTTPFSGTNNQEVGVDEADRAKLDGEFLYLLNGARLEILAVPTPSALLPVSTTPIEGYPSSILLAGERLVALSLVSRSALPAAHPLHEVFDPHEPGPGIEPGFDAAHVSRGDILKVTVFDVANRAAPLVVRELYIEGELRAARSIGSTARIVTLSRRPVDGLLTWPQLPDSFFELQEPARSAAWNRAVAEAVAINDARLDALTLDDLLPRAVERVGDSFVETSSLFSGDCESVSLPENGTGRDLTSILTLALDTPEAVIEADHIVSNGAVVYSSTDALVLAESANENWWYWNHDDFDEATNLHVFDISPGTSTEYRTSARVPGSISSAFGVSESEGRLRVATTSGLLVWRPEALESHVFVLDGGEALEIVGRVDGIARGEQLWASRFVGDRAFLVTFRNVDPLWTIDLSNPTAPEIRGELEVPGVSTYLHPIDDDHLLAVGYGGTEFGLDWTNEVSLFDVTDFSSPILQDRMTLGAPDGWGGGGESEAVRDHLAFQYWPPLGLLAVPVSGTAFHGDGWSYLSTLELVKVDAEKGLAVMGAIDHSEFFNAAGDVHWDTPQIRRSFFIGEHVIAISGRGVTTHNALTLEQTASVPLQGDDV